MSRLQGRLVALTAVIAVCLGGSAFVPGALACLLVVLALRKGDV